MGLLQRFKRQENLSEPEVPKGPGLLRAWANPGVDLERALHRAPEHVQANLGRPDGPFDPRASRQGWQETLYAPLVDGTAVTAAANTILLPDFNLPANYMTTGKAIRYTLYGRMSSVITTPGTYTFIEKWGGVGGVAMCTSGAIVPDATAASTNVTWSCEWTSVQRTEGTAGTSMTMGRLFWADINDVDLANLALAVGMQVQPAANPAVATVDTTIIKALSATVTPSVATGSIQTVIAILESLN